MTIHFLTEQCDGIEPMGQRFRTTKLKTVARNALLFLYVSVKKQGVKFETEFSQLKS